MEILDGLNQDQREAVLATDGPVMVIAGAGSGKTRVLTHRLAFIIDQGLADPFEILALTFTNKAAKEMKERIQKLIGPEAKNIWMGTFHSIFSKILRFEAEKIEYTNAFTIYDDDDSQSLLKKIIKELNLDDKKFKPRLISNNISAAKNALVSPEDFALNYVTDTFSNVVSRIYKIYNTRLKQANAMDFDDLLVKPIELFEKHPDRLYHYQRKFRYIMVDEYQDTNHAQYLITKMLAASHENICVVGDDAQSIYSFRGANIKNILNFRKDYPSAKMIKLEQNYRSTQTIVDAANSIISKNKNQIQKNVFTNNDKGDLIRVMEAATEQDEARMIVDAVREFKMRYSYRDMDFAVLYRTNAQSRAVEDQLRRAGITYKIFGGLSFYKRKEIKDTVAYLRLAINPQDEEALSRVINYPTRGIGKTTLDKIKVAMDERGMSMWEVLQNIRAFRFGGRVENPIEGFVTQIRSYIAEAKRKNAFEVASYIARHSGILKELHSENDTEGLSRWENVQELLNAAKEFSEDSENDSDKLDAFLAEISLFTDQDQKIENDDFVTLMTIHSAKGLEFPAVFLTGLEEELFPNAMSMQSRADLEEERRLFYVAVTRAKERLCLSFAKSRYKFGNIQYNEPSRFLGEIDPEFLQLNLNKLPKPLVSAGTEQPAHAGRRLKPVSAAAGGSSFSGDDLTALAPGQEVLHEKFGEGKVLSLEGSGNERKAKVFFQQKGNKVLLLKYAKLKILN